MENQRAKNIFGEETDNVGLVSNVRQQWIVHEDAALAVQLQDNEFASKYRRNCAERQQARQDVPVARAVQTSEDLRLQSEHMHRIEQQRAISEQDAVIAEQLQSAEMVNREHERTQTELKDEEFARKLQHKERVRYELRKKEKELRRQRKLLEHELQRESAELARGNSSGVVDGSRMDQTAGSLLTSGMTGLERVHSYGIAEDCGDFSDLYMPPTEQMTEEQKRQFQQLQDEEIARILQDHERRRGGSTVSCEQLRVIEARDAEIAQLMQDEERLKHRRSQRSHHQHERQVSDIGPQSHHESSEGNADRLAASLPSSMSDDISCHRDRRSTYPAVRDITLDQPIPPAEYSNKYASRPLPQTPHLPSSSCSCPYNMSLARALDHHSSQEVATHVIDSYVDESSESASPANVTSETNTRHSMSPNDRGVPICENVFAAIDPTCQRELTGSSSSSRADHQHHLASTSLAAQPVIPADINIARRRAPLVVEDHYCDLDDIQNSFGGLDLVPGQRRTPLTRDVQAGSGRGSNCKQQ